MLQSACFSGLLRKEENKAGLPGAHPVLTVQTIGLYGVVDNLPDCFPLAGIELSVPHIVKQQKEPYNDLVTLQGA